MHLSANPLVRLRAVLGDTSGVALTEFALSLPLLLTAGLWGIETANLAITTLRVNQVAMQIADNASRVGDTSTLQDRRIYESDINDLLLGSNLQAGKSIDLYSHGRVIVSSLEVVPGTNDQQYIHWQRCKGTKVYASSYGRQGDGISSSLPGMGPAGEEVMAQRGEAVIFVEVSYDYQPLVPGFFQDSRIISSTSAYTVRDSRDLTQIYQRNAGAPDPVASCTAYSGFGA
jgi:hypothetical protein